jgi:hypothetical protein
MVADSDNRISAGEGSGGKSVLGRIVGLRERFGVGGEAGGIEVNCGGRSGIRVARELSVFSDRRDEIITQVVHIRGSRFRDPDKPCVRDGLRVRYDVGRPSELLSRDCPTRSVLRPRESADSRWRLDVRSGRGASHQNALFFVDAFGGGARIGAVHLDRFL